MWAQYNLDDPNPKLIQATTMNMVDPETMAAAGRGQAEMSDLIIAMNPTYIDLSQVTPIFS